MNSIQLLIPRLFLAGCVAMFSHVAFGQDQAVPQRPKVISLPSAENVKELYVAIMGEVVKPGTYHLDPSSLKLQSVVQRAGGLTSEASPTIQVIRQGKATQKEVYSDQASTPLFPGDLLIVDLKRSGMKTTRQYSFANEPATIHAKYEERASGGGVQIALVNVVDYPLVLRLRPDDANAINIVEALGQPIELLAYTYIITPDTFPRLTSETAKRAIRLAQGSVMVFDRNRVNRNRLPSSLPKPIESEIAMGAQPGLIGSPWGQSPELRNLGHRMATDSVESNDPGESLLRRSPFESAESSLETPGQSINDNEREATPSTGSKKPRIANLPFTGIPRVANSSTLNTRSDQSASESIPQPDDSANDPSAPLIAPSITLDEGKPRPQSAYSLVQLCALTLIVGTLIAGALLLRQLLESKSIDLTAKPLSIPDDTAANAQTLAVGQQAESKSLLERLIKNELPISIETVEFPADLDLQGKIAEKPILRVDGPQSILKQNGPHFGSSDRSAKDIDLNETISHLDTQDEGIVRRPHFIDSERHKVAAAAGSSPAHQDTDTVQGNDSVKAPLAKALFQLEQGGRS